MQRYPLLCLLSGRFTQPSGRVLEGNLVSTYFQSSSTALSGRILVQGREEFSSVREIQSEGMAEGSQIVSLNIGGRHFTTDVATLKRAHTSFFVILLDKRWRHSPTEEHVMENLHFFIDRDPHYFGLILDHLRKVPFNLPSCSKAIGEIRREAEFYCLDDLLSVIKMHEFHDFGKGPIFPGDRIKVNARKLENLKEEEHSQGNGHLGMATLDYLHGVEIYCAVCGCNSKIFDGFQRAVTEMRYHDEIGTVKRVHKNGICCDATFGSSKFIYHLPASIVDLIYEY